MKIKVQAQHLQAGDIVGSGEVVNSVSAGVRTPAGKVDVNLYRNTPNGVVGRTAQWGRYTMIGVERA